MKLKLPEWMRSLFGGSTGRSSALEHRSNQVDQIIRRLDSFMTEKQPYLQPHYTIGRLSEDTGIPAYQLSAVINLRKGMNFSEYLNNLRIRHCEQLIRAPGGRKINIIDLSVVCGFHNRNTFTNAFKKLTGLTPSEYVKLYGWNGHSG